MQRNEKDRRVTRVKLENCRKPPHHRPSLFLRSLFRLPQHKPIRHCALTVRSNQLPFRSPINPHRAPYWCLMVESPAIITRNGGSPGSPSRSAIAASLVSFGWISLLLNHGCCCVCVFCFSPPFFHTYRRTLWSMTKHKTGQNRTEQGKWTYFFREKHQPTNDGVSWNQQGRADGLCLVLRVRRLWKKHQCWRGGKTGYDWYFLGWHRKSKGKRFASYHTTPPDKKKKNVVSKRQGYSLMSVSTIRWCHEPLRWKQGHSRSCMMSSIIPKAPLLHWLSYYTIRTKTRVDLVSGALPIYAFLQAEQVGH